MKGTWIQPPKKLQYHFRCGTAKNFLCGEAHKASTRQRENMFAAYVLKCRKCLQELASEEAHTT